MVVVNHLDQGMRMDHHHHHHSPARARNLDHAQNLRIAQKLTRFHAQNLRIGLCPERVDAQILRTPGGHRAPKTNALQTSCGPR